jgi:hypothetical protein
LFNHALEALVVRMIAPSPPTLDALLTAVRSSA